MIKTYAYDVEVLPNFFSVTFIDVNEYLKVFDDCCNIKIKKNKEIKIPIPLVQKLKVKEIKEKIDSLHVKDFYITDTDDSQLLSMMGFINEMKPHIENKTKVITHCFGYNSNTYDSLMMSCLLMYFGISKNTKELITTLYETSQKIISLQDNKDALRQDYFISNLNKFQLPFKNIDIMTIFALNKVGTGTNDKGEKIYFGKSLKQTSINLQWYELLDYELPPICELDYHIYANLPKYKDFTITQLNKYVDKWDRYMINDYIKPTMHYNRNDVLIVCEMIRLYIDEIRLRYNISKVYEVDVLSSSRSNIADNLFVRFYSEFSNLQPSQWRGKSTERHALSFKKVIFPFIKFETEELNELLEELKHVTIYSVGKKALKDIEKSCSLLKHYKSDTTSGWFEITINNLTYTIATGGLHSKDLPRELKSKIIYLDNIDNTDESIWNNITEDSYIYIHFDISSFYPSIMDVYRIAPAHLDEGVFTKLIHWLKETRINAKHSEEEFIDGIPKDTLAQVLKIVINSIYGKLGFAYGDLCDTLAVLKVTINGQLLIMILCERLELAGIEVMSANTDGIVVKLYKKDKKKFDNITETWMKETKLEADSEEYKAYINRDIDIIGVLTA